MKKFFAIAVLAAVCTMSASAQISWGLRGGLNYVSNDITAISTETVLNSDNYTGFFFGPMTELRIPNTAIGLEAALLYTQKGLKIAEGDEMKNASLAVPASLKLTFDKGGSLVYFVHAGGQFDYKTGDLDRQIASVKENDATKAEVRDFILNKSTWSVNVGAGIKVSYHLQLSVNYNIPVTEEGVYAFRDNVSAATIDSLEEAGEESRKAFRSSTLQFALAFLF